MKKKCLILTFYCHYLEKNSKRKEKNAAMSSKVKKRFLLVSINSINNSKEILYIWQQCISW